MTDNNNTKIILCDDDPTMRSLLETLLGMEGYHALSFIESTDEKFIDYLIAEQPQAVLLDVHLTYSNGIDLLVKIKQKEQLKDMAVLLTSGMDLRKECMEKGADGFLLKPYMPDDLISWLHKILD
ncbi:MAG: response regulator [Anaerolineaceae bacterium]|jgi:CheY-like chemotaxis protein|nr:response regulator [Anaerolineaceae bacterium]